MAELNEAQSEAVRTAADGTRFRFGGTLYAKQGNSLVPVAAQEAASAATPTAAPSATPQGQAQRPVPAAIRVLDVAGETLKQPIDRFMKGAEGAVKGAGALPGAILNAPAAISQEAADLRADPATAGKKLVQGVVSAFGGPLGEKAAHGTLPSPWKDPLLVGDVAETAGGVAGSQALTGAVGSAAKQLTGGVVKNLPGAQVERHAMTAEEMRAIPGQYAPPPGAVAAEYATMDAMGNPIVPMTKFKTRVDELIQAEEKLPKTQQDEKWIEYLRGLEQDTSAGWSVDTLKAFQERVGSQLRTKRAYQPGHAGPTFGRDAEMRSLMKQGYADIQDAHPQIADQWTKARGVAQSEKSAAELGTRINKAISRTGDANETAGGLNSLITDMVQAREAAGMYHDKAMQRFVKGFQPAEFRDIIDTLTAMKQQLPAMPAGKGVPTGSSRVLTATAVGTGLGTLAGHVTGSLPAGAAIGSLAAAGGPVLIAKAMTTQLGRSAVRRAMQMDPAMGTTFREIVAAGVRAAVPPEEAKATGPHDTARGPATKEYYRSQAELALGGPEAHADDVKHLADVHKGVDKGKTPDVQQDLQRQQVSLPSIKQTLGVAARTDMSSKLEGYSLEQMQHMIAVAKPDELHWLLPAVRQKLSRDVQNPKIAPWLKSQTQQLLAQLPQ